MFERNSQIEEAFSRASEQLRAGEPLDAVLAQYPDQAAELAVLLETVQTVRDTTAAPVLSAAALARIQARTQQAVLTRRRGVAVQPTRPADRETRVLRRPWYATLFGSPLRANLAAMALVVLALTGLVSVVLRPTAPTSQTYLGVISALGAATTYVARPDGSLRATADSQWQVGDDSILITPDTVIYGQPVVGAIAVCTGQLDPLTHSIKALRVTIEEATRTPAPLPTSTTPAAPTETAQPTAAAAETAQPTPVSWPTVEALPSATSGGPAPAPSATAPPTALPGLPTVTPRPTQPVAPPTVTPAGLGGGGNNPPATGPTKTLTAAPALPSETAPAMATRLPTATPP
nr:hypothetical protein [Chloroflexota bacterium]